MVTLLVDVVHSLSFLVAIEFSVFVLSELVPPDPTLELKRNDSIFVVVARSEARISTFEERIILGLLLGFSKDPGRLLLFLGQFGVWLTCNKSPIALFSFLASGRRLRGSGGGIVRKPLPTSERLVVVTLSIRSTYWWCQ